MSRLFNFPRVAGVGAIAFAAAIVTGNLIAVPAGLPTVGTYIDKVDVFFETQGGVVGLASALTPLAWVFATLFGAGAVAVLRRHGHADTEAWSLVGFGGILMQNIAFAGIIAVRLGLAAASPYGTAGNAVLWKFHDALFTLNGTFLAVALVGLSVAGLRAGLTRPWHGVLGLLSAALMFGSATLAPLVIDRSGPLGLLGLVGWLLWVVWIVAYGIVLIRLKPTSAGLGSRIAAG
ncbi:hypothetical protein SAMN05421505_109173 [Sinosporangium album]|uniref:DUF4386 family protein n=1 Tax=Sinosporangium album TaxID=504805 RepID=A0A1G7YB74_9ACTN|nr:hypothetical protein [Sinosporangium album]SDG93559.1 hypothetical protein SAMN05421505_109173 [Sinosporangium album]